MQTSPLAFFGRKAEAARVRAVLGILGVTSTIHGCKELPPGWDIPGSKGVSLWVADRDLQKAAEILEAIRTIPASVEG